MTHAPRRRLRVLLSGTLAAALCGAALAGCSGTPSAAGAGGADGPAVAQRTPTTPSTATSPVRREVAAARPAPHARDRRSALRSLARAAGAAATRRVGPAQLNPDNPIAHPAWHAAREEGGNPELEAYASARNPADKAALGRIALTPRFHWFANCPSCHPENAAASVASYIADVQQGDPRSLAQIAIFGLWPRGEVIHGDRPDLGISDAAYESWIRNLAAGIGDARVAIVLEPDLAISANPPGTAPRLVVRDAARRLGLVRWAAGYLSSHLPHEAIYLDAGSADWLSVDESVRLLRATGIQDVRGFALGATHYDSVAANVQRAADLATALRRAGLGIKHAIIDTADNGTPFTWAQWHARYGARFDRTHNPVDNFNDAPPCTSLTETVCMTIGHQPTADPLGPEADEIGLGPDQPALRTEAARYVDGLLWFGRGWRGVLPSGGNAPSLSRMVDMARYSRFTAPG